MEDFCASLELASGRSLLTLYIRGRLCAQRVYFDVGQVGKTLGLIRGNKRVRIKALNMEILHCLGPVMVAEKQEEDKSRNCSENRIASHLGFQRHHT